MTPVRCALLSVALVAVLVVGSAASPSTANVRWHWPTVGDHRVERGFAPPLDAYGAGHRGVDLRAMTGSAVSSVAAGTVSYVGSIDGVAMITIDHGGERSTYQPVLASVSRGERVESGEVIGRLLRTGSHCSPHACLHVGRKSGDTYLDPLALLQLPARARLVDPFGALPRAASSSMANGFLLRPTRGEVSSPFGMRRHPITGEVKLHDGTDFATACGTPVQAAAAGRVVRTYEDKDYGKRVFIDHGMWQGRRIVTIYNHLSSDNARVGQRVNTGQLIARVGTTGLSTGCHLHFMVERNGTTVNAAPLLR